MSSIEDIPEHIPPYKLIVTLDSYDSNPDTPFMKKGGRNAERYALISPMSFCPGFRGGIGWGFDFYHHQVHLMPDQSDEFCTLAFSVLVPFLNVIDISGPINKEPAEDVNGLEVDEDTLYIKCPHGMATFKVHREPVTCPDCGEKPLYVEKYDRWYCSVCEKYTEPVDDSIAWPAKDRAPNEPSAAPDYWQYLIASGNNIG